jgi:hypothetical protein
VIEQGTKAPPANGMKAALIEIPSAKHWSLGVLVIDAAAAGRFEYPLPRRFINKPAAFSVISWRTSCVDPLF